MRFILVEELKSLDNVLSSRGAVDIEKYADKVTSATRRGKSRGVERSAKKMIKSASKALDALSKEDQKKIKNVRDIFEIAASGGVNTNHFKFLASLPDDAYADRDKLKYFVDQIDKKIIEVPYGASQPTEQSGEQEGSVTEESLQEALGDYFFPYNDKDGIYYNGSLWQLDNSSFRVVLDAFNKLNKKKYATDKLGDKRATREIVNDIFVSSDGKVRQPSELKDTIDTAVKNYERETEESKKRTIEEYAKDKGFNDAYRLLESLIKNYHNRLSIGEHGYEDAKYYLYALKSLWANYLDRARQKEGSLGKRKADFLQELITKVKYTDPTPEKILSDFERAVDDRVQKGILNFDIVTDSRGG